MRQTWAISYMPIKMGRRKTYTHTQEDQPLSLSASWMKMQHDSWNSSCSSYINIYVPIISWRGQESERNIKNDSRGWWNRVNTVLNRLWNYQNLYKKYFFAVLVSLRCYSIAVRRQHDYGNLQKTALIGDLLLMVSEGQSMKESMVEMALEQLLRTHILPTGTSPRE